MRKVALFLAVAVASAASFSQPARAEQDKASEVLAAVQKAIGGGKLGSMKTFSLQAKTARNSGQRQITTDVELYLEIPDKYLRVDNISAPMAMTMQAGFNGDKPIRPSGGNMGMSGGAPFVIMNGGPAGGGHVAPAGAAPTAMVRTEMIMAGGGGARGVAPGGEMTPEQQALMNTTMVRNQRIEASRMMLGWFGMAHPTLKATYTYAGEAESPDGKAHIIAIKADGGFEAKLFVDQATNLPLMLQWTTMERAPFNFNPGTASTAGAPVVSGGTPPPPPPPPAGGAPGSATTTSRGPMTPEQRAEMQKAFEEWQKTPANLPVEHRIFYSDWKEVDGIQFPHLMQRARAGTTTEEWTIEKVKVNPKIDAKKFDTQ